MTPITPYEMTLRILLALGMGLILGWERERHGRAAGLRTTMLVCVAAAIVAVLSQYWFFESSQGTPNWHPDPARLAAGVLAGMGFLGAGVIIRQDNAIHGVTTAAVLWFSAILGMALGAGYITLGLIGFGIAVVALFILPPWESYIQADRYAVLSVYSSLPGPEVHSVKAGVEGLRLSAKLKPSGLEIDQVLREKVIHFEVKVKRRHQQDCQVMAVNWVSKLKGVKKVIWQS